jgi:hypothetical protein
MVSYRRVILLPPLASAASCLVKPSQVWNNKPGNLVEKGSLAGKRQARSDEFLPCFMSNRHTSRSGFGGSVYDSSENNRKASCGRSPNDPSLFWGFEAAFIPFHNAHKKPINDLHIIFTFV